MASIAKFDNRQFSDGTPVGMVKQALMVRSNSTVKSSSGSPGAWVDIISTSVTVEAGSRLFLWFHGHYTQTHMMDNPVIDFQIDGVSVGNWSTRHYFYMDGTNSYQFRPVVDLPMVTDPLTAGTHTVTVRFQASQGNATISFDVYTVDYPNRAMRLNIMEISG